MKKELENHHNLEIKDSGLCIPQWPFIDVSPDSIICCQYHGTGVLKVKCPYCHVRRRMKHLHVSHLDDSVTQ